MNKIERTNLAAIAAGLEAAAAALRSMTDVPTTVAAAKPVAAKVQVKAPAKPKAPTAKQAEFVTWLQATAPARAARKADNKALAASMRAAGIEVNAETWAEAKAAAAYIQANTAV